MAVGPGGLKEQSIRQRELALASDLFKETVAKGELPPTFTPLNVDQIGIPGHKPVVRAVLANFARFGSYASEYNAENVPAEEKKRIAARYKRTVEWYKRSDVGVEGARRAYPVQMEKLKVSPKNYSPRLHCLVLAHTPEWKDGDVAPLWDEDSQAVYFFMSDILGPTLGFNYDARQLNAPGDYGILVDWVFKNVEKIKQLYLRKDDPLYLDTQLARGSGVVVDTLAFQNLSNTLQIHNQFNPAEATSIEKLPLTNAEFAVSPDKSTVLDFVNLFVNPDQHGGIDGFGDGLDAEWKASMGQEGIKKYCDRINFISLLNLAILQDIPGKGEPLKKLDAKLGFGGKLKEILNEYLILVRTAEENPSVLKTLREGVSSEDQLGTLGQADLNNATVMSMLETIHPDWGNHSLGSALELILKDMSNAEHIGLGSGRALVVQYNEQARTQGQHHARLLHLMGMMLKIAKGDGKFGLLDYYYDKIVK